MPTLVPILYAISALAAFAASYSWFMASRLPLGDAQRPEQLLADIRAQAMLSGRGAATAAGAALAWGTAMVLQLAI